MNDTKFDWQLPDSLARAIRFEHRIHSPYVTLVLWLTASQPYIARAKQASCLLDWPSMFTVTGCSAFPFCSPRKPLIRLNIKNKNFSFWKVHGIMSCKVNVKHFARDPKYSWFHEPSKYRIHFFNTLIQTFLQCKSLNIYTCYWFKNIYFKSVYTYNTILNHTNIRIRMEARAYWVILLK